MNEHEIVYMIENVVDNTFWTNNGFKKHHGNLYRNESKAQHQIDKGKLSLFFRRDDRLKENIQVSKFKLERIE